MSYDDDFYKREQFKADLKKSQRETDRIYEESKDREEKKRLADERLADSIDKRSLQEANLESKEKIASQRIAYQKELEEKKNNQNLMSAEVQATGLANVEELKTKREIELKRMDVEANARMLRAQQVFEEKKYQLEIIHKQNISDIEVFEYARKRDIDRQADRDSQNQLHQHKIGEIREALKGAMLTKRLDHQQRMEFETHQTNEKIRYAKAMAELNKTFSNVTDKETLDILERFMPDWDVEFDNNS